MVLGVLLVSVGACGSSNSNPPTDSGSGTQWDFQQTVLNDRGDLFSAALRTRGPDRVNVGAPFTIEVQVCGPAAGCGASASGSSAQPTSSMLPTAFPTASTQPTASPTPAASPEATVKAGAIMQVRLDTDMNGKIIRSPPDKQPVIAASDSAEWSWRLRADAPGRYQFAIHVAPLARDTELPLEAEVVSTVTVTVADTMRHRLGSAWSLASGIFATAGVAVGVLAAMGGAAVGARKWWVARLRKATRGQPAPRPGHPRSGRPASPRRRPPRVRPPRPPA
jgi:hypothetical protein